MKLNYSSEKYEFWVTLMLTDFERKLENETAFDGVVKIYSVTSNSEQLNNLLDGKLFGDFIFPSDTGIFLRMFKSKSSWPCTKLIHIDLGSYLIDEIKETNSSWDVWTGDSLGYGKFAINISPKEVIEYTTY
ncbi:MAG TPA: hypothetical protein VK173_07525 [Lacibacter sp.]|nr:hypothetical protein [Lacibacter sp.]